MKKSTKFVLALITSGALALGATAPAVAGPPSPDDNDGIANACSVVDSDAGGGAAHRVLGC